MVVTGSGIDKTPFSVTFAIANRLQLQKLGEKCNNPLSVVTLQPANRNVFGSSHIQGTLAGCNRFANYHSSLATTFAAYPSVTWKAGWSNLSQPSAGGSGAPSQHDRVWFIMHCWVTLRLQQVLVNNILLSNQLLPPHQSVTWVAAGAKL